MSHHSLNQHPNQPGSPHRERGQGFVEYVIIIALVGVAVIAIINILEPAIANVFSQFVGNAPVAPPSLLSYTPPPTYTPTATPITGPIPPTPTATNTPLGFPTPTNTNTPTNTPTNTATPTNTPTPTPTATPGPNILFVVGSNPNSLNASDTWVRTQLAALNPLYPGDQSKILVRRDDQATTADADNMDLVVISSTVDPPGDVGTKFRDVQVPVLLWERNLYDEMRMTAGGDHGTANNRNEIDIANINHPLRGNVETGNQVVYDSNQTLSWGIPNGNAVAIASMTGGGSNQDRKVIFGYPAGAQMIGSPPFNAPARRVGFFLFDDSADNLDPRGRILFANAVIWARGN